MENLFLKRIIFFLIFSLFALFSQNVLAKDYYLRNNLYFENVSVTGAGKSNSFLTKGNNFKNEISLGVNQNKGDFYQNLNIGAFATDDPRLEPEKITLRNFLWQLRKGDYDFSLGDVFADFSEYSLNAGIKGINFSRIDLNGFDIDIAAGIAKSDWRYLWDKNSQELKDIYHMGLNIGKQVSRDFQANLIYVFTNENKAENQTTSVDLNKNNLISLLWKFNPAAGVKIYGESAISNNMLKGGSSKNDMADKLNINVNSDKLKSKLMYERVGTDFVVPGGLAVKDREKFYFKNRYYASPKGEFFVNYTYYRNNLDGSAKTTYNHLPEMGFTRKRLFNRRHLETSLRSRYAKRYRQDKLTDTDDLATTLSISDIFGMYSFSLNYVNDIVNDKTSMNDDWTVNTANLNVSRQWFLGEAMLKPTASLTLEKRSGSNSKSGVFSGGFGLNADIEQRLNFYLNYNLSNIANTQTDDLKTHAIVCSVEYELSSQNDAGLFKQNRIGISYAENDNTYQTASQSYKEKIFSVFWKVEL